MNKITLNNKQMPLHYQISNYMEDMLKRGDLLPDVQVPTEKELASIFGVSRATIRRSMEHLLGKRLLTRKQGKGTFWTFEARSLLREKLAGLNKHIFILNENTPVKVLSKTLEEAGSDVIGFFGAAAADKFTVFRRIRYAVGEPLSYTINYLPEIYGSKISAEHLENMTMLETLESVLKLQLGTIEHEVEITRATDEVAKHLSIRVLEPVLTVRTSVFGRDGFPIETVWTHFVENRYKFRVVLE